jgi:hypothetical protein
MRGLGSQTPIVPFPICMHARAFVVLLRTMKAVTSVKVVWEG